MWWLMQLKQSNANQCLKCLCSLLGYSSAVLVSNHPAVDPSTLRDMEKTPERGEMSVLKDISGSGHKSGYSFQCI